MKKSAEHKAKIGAAMRRFWQSPEARAAQSAKAAEVHHERGRAGAVTFTCAYCGIEFERPLWQRTRPHPCCCIAHANKLRAQKRD